MKLFLLVLAAASMVACGKSETVKIGEPGEDGAYQKQIETSKDTAAQASEQVKQNDKEAFGS